MDDIGTAQSSLSGNRFLRNSLGFAWFAWFEKLLNVLSN